MGSISSKDSPAAAADITSPSPGPPLPAPTAVNAQPGETDLRMIVFGELDAPGVSRLREHVDRTLGRRRPATIELDLAGVPFLDVSAAIELRRLHHHVADAGGQLSITTAQPFTWWLLNAFALTSASAPNRGHLQPEPGS